MVSQQVEKPLRVYSKLFYFMGNQLATLQMTCPADNQHSIKKDSTLKDCLSIDLMPAYIQLLSSIHNMYYKKVTDRYNYNKQ